ncbi:class I adenylate-forming enzyme family protein [Oleomonas cavernae]|nr:class I adenylate-forming enzyme family protein [Oleomonas cavernae]
MTGQWPAVTLGQAQAILTAPGARFEMEERTIRGEVTRVWKNAPPAMPDLVAIARTHGQRLFAVYEDERVTYDAFYRATAAFAAYLVDRGVKKGDRVALALRNLPEWAVIYCAAACVGAIAVPLNAWWTGVELDYGLADSGARLLVCDGERHERIAPHLPALPALEQVIVCRGAKGPQSLEGIIGRSGEWALLPDLDLPPADLSPDDDMSIFYTSGTTGNPKGALGTHRNALTNPLSSAYSAARSILRRGEAIPAPVPKVNLLVIPLFHVTACNAGLMAALASGSTLVMMRKWDALKALELIEREKVTTTGGVPTIAWQILEHPERHRFDLSSLESIAYGGAPSAPELVRQIAGELKAVPGNGWGMTETSATFTHHAAEDYLNRPDSCGPPVAVADLKIMSLDGSHELPTGEVGELWAKGPQVVKGYWNNPQATAASFIDGWVKTGDLARVDAEGFCYIVDRAKDIIIRGGENIYSIEVENVLYDYPGVTDAALIGLPHRTLGEVPAAVIHLAPGARAAPEELLAFLRTRLAPFKVPVRIVFQTRTLPRNANGKIMKKDLQALFTETAA